MLQWELSSLVALFKRLLKKKLGNLMVNLNELMTVLMELSKMLNTRPLVSTFDSNPKTWRLVTPAYLIGIRDTEPLCTVPASDGKPVTKL